MVGRGNPFSSRSMTSPSAPATPASPATVAFAAVPSIAVAVVVAVGVGGASVGSGVANVSWGPKDPVPTPVEPTEATTVPIFVTCTGTDGTDIDGGIGTTNAGEGEASHNSILNSFFIHA